PGVIGFKTGYTNQAQHSLVAAARRNGRTLVAVILGAPDAGYTEAANLLDAGFAMPTNATGLGLTVPPVRVSLYANRADLRHGFAALGHATAAPTPAAAGPPVPASIPVGEIAPHGAPSAIATTHAAPAKSGLLTLRNVMLVVFFLLVVAFFLRRR